MPLARSAASRRARTPVARVARASAPGPRNEFRGVGGGEGRAHARVAELQRSPSGLSTCRAAASASTPYRLTGCRHCASRISSVSLTMG